MVLQFAPASTPHDLWPMAKEQERRLARTMYIDQGRTAKEIAQRLKVTENTVGNWVKVGNWQEVRNAKQNMPDQTAINLKELINDLTQKRIDMESDPTATAKDKAKLADEASKWTKALEALRVKGAIPLSTQLAVIERLFDELGRKHPDILIKLVDFQEEYITELARQCD